MDTPAPLTVVVHPDDYYPNQYMLVRGDRWIARIHFTGEAFVEEQEPVVAAMAAAATTEIDRLLAASGKERLGRPVDFPLRHMPATPMRQAEMEEQVRVVSEVADLAERFGEPYDG